MWSLRVPTEVDWRSELDPGKLNHLILGSEFQGVLVWLSTRRDGEELRVERSVDGFVGGWTLRIENEGVSQVAASLGLIQRNCSRLGSWSLNEDHSETRQWAGTIPASKRGM
ncbi:hypothetical protein AMECASPLE_030985 [Ameca splendens]|uniref:Uncharacterized protein n=1 Tax=Ameca splendens TaxID=208324 RepID=A0ABV0YHP7_9TELE